jgi:hypothetical protein
VAFVGNCAIPDEIFGSTQIFPESKKLYPTLLQGGTSNFLMPKSSIKVVKDMALWKFITMKLAGQPK